MGGDKKLDREVKQRQVDFYMLQKSPLAKRIKRGITHYGYLLGRRMWIGRNYPLRVDG